MCPEAKDDESTRQSPLSTAVLKLAPPSSVGIIDKSLRELSRLVHVVSQYYIYSFICDSFHILILCVAQKE